MIFLNMFSQTTEYVDPIVKMLGDNGDWLTHITLGSVIVRLILAIFCGGVLGAERAMKRQAAGFRTYILVAVGAAIAGFTNEFIALSSASSDIGRIGNGVVTGIGFLGAGTILVTSRNKIKGLTTAAALWACGCMGLSIGHGFYTLGIAASIIIFLVLSVTPPIEHYFIDKARAFTLHVELHSRTNLKDFIGYLRANSYSIVNVEHNIAYASSGLSVYSISLVAPHMKGSKSFSQQMLCTMLNELEYVNHVEVLF